MIKTVIFDLGNVLVPFDFARGYARLEKLCGKPLEEMRSRIHGVDLYNRFESGTISASDFHQEMCSVLGADISYEDFCSIWNCVFFPDANVPVQMLQALRRKYRLVLLSNTNPIHFEMLDRTYPQLAEFDARILSHEVQAMKPHEKIYRAAIEAAQCEPSECFYTDDIIAYVEGARLHGIDAEQFTNYEKLLKDLDARGIVWQ